MFGLTLILKEKSVVVQSQEFVREYSHDYGIGRAARVISAIICGGDPADFCVSREESRVPYDEAASKTWISEQMFMDLVVEDKSIDGAVLKTEAAVYARLNAMISGEAEVVPPKYPLTTAVKLNELIMKSNIADAELLIDLRTALHNADCILTEIRKSGTISEARIFPMATTTFGNACVDIKNFAMQR